MLTDEKYIKDLLFRVINKKESNYIAIPEISIKSVVADALLVNNSINIFEIKSCRDSIQRLNKQLQVYLNYANYVTVVVGAKFYEKYKGRLIELQEEQGIGVSLVQGATIETLKAPIRRSLAKKDNYLEYWTITDQKLFLKGLKGSYKMYRQDADKLLGGMGEPFLHKATIEMLKAKHKRENGLLVGGAKKASDKRYYELQPKYETHDNYKNYSCLFSGGLKF